MSGHYIVVEGLEGAGKTTAIKTIKSYLLKHNLKIITTREPGGTEVGETVRSLITQNDGTLEGRCELLLLYAARIQLMKEVIKPALLSGHYVIADRNELSSYAYQGGGRKLGFDFINKLSKFSLDFKPSLIIFLDIHPKRGMNRIMMRGELDSIEKEEISFFFEISKAYQKIIKQMDNVVVIDANQPLKSVQSDIKAALETYLKLWIKQDDCKVCQ